MSPHQIDRPTVAAFLCGDLSDDEARLVQEAIGNDPSVRELADELERTHVNQRRMLQSVLPLAIFAREPQFRASLDKADSVWSSLGGPCRSGDTPFLEERGQSHQPDATFRSHFGDYELLEVLDSGGMGTVYKARHIHLNRLFALKIISSHRTGCVQARRRFMREVALNGRLQHPHLVHSVSAGEDAGEPFLVMELLDGKDVGQITAERGKLPVPAACEIVRQAAIGVQFLASNGFVHRDLKPSNLMLSRMHSGDPLRPDATLEIVKVLDLGLACEPQTADLSEITMTDQVLGSIDYLAPEQASDPRRVDARTDIYALGCTLYKLLAGQAPFAGPGQESLVAKLFAHHDSNPIALRTLRPDVSRELARVVARAMAKKPRQRFPTPQDFAKALEPFCSNANLAELLQPPPEKTHQESSAAPGSATFHPPRRGWTALIVASLTVMAGILIHVQFTPGELVITAPDDGVGIRISHNGSPVDERDLPAGESIVRVAAGDVEISISGADADEFRVQNGRVSLRRGKREIVVIERSRPSPETAENRPLDWAERQTVTPVTAPFDAEQASRFQQAWAASLSIPAEVTNSLGMHFRTIPPGRFVPESKLAHIFVESPFLMATREVTNAEFQQVMGRPPREPPSGSIDPDIPAGGVSRSDAIDFCRRLSQLPEERRAGRIYALPTGPEWEWACRAGSQPGLPWPLKQVRHHAVLQEPAPLPPASFASNPFGLFDMHGNIAEWSADWLHSAVTEENFPNTDLVAVLCGGSFDSDRPELTAASARQMHDLNQPTRIDFGLRVVCRFLDQLSPTGLSDEIQRPEVGFDQMVAFDTSLRGWGFPGGVVMNQGGILEQVVGAGSRWGTLWYGRHGNLNDFDLRFDFKVEGPETESVLMFRANMLEKGWQEGSCYRFYLSGTKFGQLIRFRPPHQGVVAEVPIWRLTQTRPDTWNRLVVRCEDRRTRIWLNDELAIDFVDPVPGVCLRGPLSFLTTGSTEGPALTARFRNLRIRLLGSARPEELAPMPWTMDANARSRGATLEPAPQ